MTTRHPDIPPVVSRTDWLVARKRLLAAEKASTRQRDELSAERRRLPIVRIEEEYVFEGPEGNAHLLDLFDGRRQLIIHHLTYSTFARGVELRGPTSNFFDLTPLGRQDEAS